MHKIVVTVVDALDNIVSQSEGPYDEPIENWKPGTECDIDGHACVVEARFDAGDGQVLVIARKLRSI